MATTTTFVDIVNEEERHVVFEAEEQEMSQLRAYVLNAFSAIVLDD
jgi:hypothetical protein